MHLFMLRDQARDFLRHVAMLPKDALGSGYTFIDNQPCCAIGYLAAQAGMTPRKLGYPATTSRSVGQDEVCHLYALSSDDLNTIVSTNDEAGHLDRWDALQRAARGIVRRHGFDPDELLAEAPPRA